jgi:hypothetical protein
MANSIVKMASVSKYVMGQMRNPQVAKLYHDGDHPLAVAMYHAAEKKIVENTNTNKGVA